MIRIFKLSFIQGCSNGGEESVREGHLISGHLISFSTRRIIRQIKCYMNNISLNFCFYVVFLESFQRWKCKRENVSFIPQRWKVHITSSMYIFWLSWTFHCDFQFAWCFFFVKIELKSSVFVSFCFIWMFYLIWNELWWLLFRFWI